MFTSLTDGVRHIRVPLTVGYFALLAVWLWFADDLDGPYEDGSGVQRLDEAFDGLRATGRLAVLSFTALLIGGVAQRVVEAAGGAFGSIAGRGPVGDAQAELNAVRGQLIGIIQDKDREIELRDTTPERKEARMAESAQAPERLATLQEELLRLKSERELRLWILAASTPASLTLIVTDGDWFWLLVLAPILLSLDVWFLGRRARGVGEDAKHLLQFDPASDLHGKIRPWIEIR